MTPEQLDELEALHAAGDIDPFPVTAKALREAWEVIDHYERKDGPTFQAHLGEVRAEWSLAEAKAEIERLREDRDKAYRERNQAVALAATLAVRQGIPAGSRKHEPDPDPNWPEGWSKVVHVELPTGQVSWHLPDSEGGLIENLPAYPKSWDGHSPTVKEERILAFLGGSVAAGLPRYGVALTSDGTETGPVERWVRDAGGSGTR